MFCTLDGKKLEDAYVRVLLPRLGRKAGLEQRIHAHGLRHSHAYKLSQQGWPMNAVQAQLGHSTLATTGVYLAHIGANDLVRRMKMEHWGL